ncbi:MAG: hypothetical protein ACQEV7_07030 [Bacillota bacterium]
MKKLFKALSFLLVISSGILTLLKMNKSNKEMIAKETTSFQVKQTLSAIAATLEQTEVGEKTSVTDLVESRQAGAKNMKKDHQTKETSDSEENAPLIKGNKNGRGEYIYHMPGGVFYNRTTPVEWFHTEAEAQEKGYRKSVR